MNLYLMIAGVLMILLGLVHSILGEILIFKKKRLPGLLVPTMKSQGLRRNHLRIIWATWHFATLFGFAIAAILIQLSLTPDELNTDLSELIILSIALASLLSGFLVAIATKARHAGWVVFVAIGLLVLMA